jgi:Rps23 Pro-64 3,4-dihydroxylase Tpa1-like proline 4-hydroxylase
MKCNLTVAAILLTLNVFAQTLALKESNAKVDLVSSKIEEDTILKVQYIKKDLLQRKPAVYINGQFFNDVNLLTIDPKNIESINVEKQTIKVENIQYYGQINIKMKERFHPKLISLNDLKLKYTSLSNIPTIFMIGDQVISENYDKYFVDDNYILKIIVEKVENKAENLEFNLIRLLPKTEENIRKSKEIRIRGTEEIAIND